MDSERTPFSVASLLFDLDLEAWDLFLPTAALTASVAMEAVAHPFKQTQVAVSWNDLNTELETHTED